jgi:hypothetical protein
LLSASTVPFQIAFMSLDLLPGPLFRPAHGGEHTFAAQDHPAGQARPHAPQFCGSTLSSKQPGGLTQQLKPAAQEPAPGQVHVGMPFPSSSQISPSAQATPSQTHSSFALHAPPGPQSAFELQSHSMSLPAVVSHTRPIIEHALPHPPHASSVSSWDSHPSSGAGGRGVWQSPQPRMQVARQVPPSHVVVSPFAAEQARPHAPQFWASVPSATSQPFLGSPSQSPKSAGQPPPAPPTALELPPPPLLDVVAAPAAPPVPRSVAAL